MDYWRNPFLFCWYDAAQINPCVSSGGVVVWRSWSRITCHLSRCLEAAFIRDPFLPPDLKQRLRNTGIKGQFTAGRLVLHSYTKATHQTVGCYGLRLKGYFITYPNRRQITDAFMRRSLNKGFKCMLDNSNGRVVREGTRSRDLCTYVHVLLGWTVETRKCHNSVQSPYLFVASIYGPNIRYKLLPVQWCWREEETHDY